MSTANNIMGISQTSDTFKRDYAAMFALADEVMNNALHFMRDSKWVAAELAAMDAAKCFRILDELERKQSEPTV